MKISSSTALVIICCLVCGSLALGESEFRIRPKLVAEPLASADATSFPFEIIYESDVALDLTTLGDDDVIVGRQRLFSFRREIGQEPTHARFVSAEADEAGTTVVAKYELPRPEDGWEAWMVPRLDVDILAGSVKDIDGQVIAAWGVGSGFYNGLNLALESLHELEIRRLNRVPQVGALDTTFEFDVVYEANYPLDADLFGSGEMKLVSQELTTIDLEGEPIEIGMLSGEPFEIEVADVDAAVDNQSMTVTYRAFRPDVGWSESGLDLVILAEPFALGDNARGWYSAGSPGLGYIHPLSEGEPSSTLVALPLASEDQAQYTFQVIYEHPSGIDLGTLGDDDLTTKPTSKSLSIAFFTSELEVALEARLTSIESDNNSTRVTASYVFDRPLDGWRSLSRGGPNLFVSTVDGSVSANDGTPIRDALLGHVSLEAETSIAAQIVGFDSWVRDLGQSLGFEQAITATSDADKDGSEDVLELVLGTHPNDPGDVPGLNPKVVRVGETPHFQMTLEQPTTIGAFTLLEGSADGEFWEDALPHFEPVDLAAANRSGIITLRSIPSLEGLPFQYFRVRVIPVR